MYSDYYLIGGVIIYLICIGYCSYKCSTLNSVKPSCLTCFNSEDSEYKLINV